MKNQATQERKSLATAAMMAVMATTRPNKRKTLRRLTSRAKHRQKHLPFVVVHVYLYIHLVVVFCLNKLFCKLLTCATLQVGPAQDVMPLRIHRDNMFVSGEAWRLFQEAHPNHDFSDFCLEVSLRFSMECFDLSSFFFLRKRESSSAANSCSSRIPKMEPLSSITDELDFAYASDIAEDNSRKPGHIVELSF
jgi:hypothetical protein